MRGLYAIVDVDTLANRDLDPVRFADAVLRGRPAALQLRAKSAAREASLELIRELRSLCAAAGVPFVINDRPDLALIAKADMVHIGQGDASPALVRSLAPSLGIGISTHTPEQFNDALRESPRYVAFGPVFPTRSKALPDPVVGVSGLAQAARLLRHFRETNGAAPPLVAIGGITLERVTEIARFVACAAVIADLLPPADLVGEDAYDYVHARTKQFGEAFTDPTELEPFSEHVR